MAYFLLNIASFNLFLVLLFLVRKLLNRQLSPLYQGRYWNLAGLGMLFFVPNQLITQFRELIYYRLQDVVSNKEVSESIQLDHVRGMAEATSAGWMNNNALPANPFLEKLLVSLFVVWAVGTTIVLIRSLHSYSQFRRMIRKAEIVVNDQSYVQLERAQRRVNYHRKGLSLLQSKEISSPATFGIFHPSIIIPSSFIESAPEEQLYFILLHELVHQKRKDALQNYLLMGISIVNWFNPISYLMMKQARKDREISCDQAVMRVLDDEDIFFYGSTLLDCADRNGNSYLLGFSDKRSELKQRIELISSFKHSSTKKLAIRFGLISILVAGLFLLVPQARTEEKDQLSKQHMTIEQKSDPLFDKNDDNSLVIYDEAGARYLTYNQAGGHTRYSPDSTYKIWSALFALDEKKIDQGDNVKAWNGTKYPIKSWNQDQNLQMALTNSTNWYFQQLDFELGKAKLKEKFQSINYGNMNLLGGLDNYWLESSLKISPFEQVDLLRKLFKGEMQFSAEDTAFVKQSIRLQEQPEYSLYGKTGTGNSVSASTGWFIGSLETTKGDYYFACHLQGEGATGSAAAQKTFAILRDLEIY